MIKKNVVCAHTHKMFSIKVIDKKIKISSSMLKYDYNNIVHSYE
jgi:hypothetical protein